MTTTTEYHVFIRDEPDAPWRDCGDGPGKTRAEPEAFAPSLSMQWCVRDEEEPKQ